MRKYEAKQGRRHLGATGVKDQKKGSKDRLSSTMQPILFLCMHTHNSHLATREQTPGLPC